MINPRLQLFGLFSFCHILMYSLVDVCSPLKTPCLLSVTLLLWSKLPVLFHSVIPLPLSLTSPSVMVRLLLSPLLRRGRHPSDR